MTRPAFTPFARAVLVALVLGVLACGIMALLLGKAKADGAPLLPVICGNFAEMAEGMAQQFGEVPAARGQIGPDVLLVVLASPGGSFTVLAVRATGAACVIAAGRGWEGRL